MSSGQPSRKPVGLAGLQQSLKKIMTFNTDYKILDPNGIYHGKSYSDWTIDWFNWFVSTNADKRNSGPVVFLRSHGLPNKTTGAYTGDSLNSENAANTDNLPDVYSLDINYPSVYVNDPNIRVGGDKLQIFSDQAVFVPIIIAYNVKVAPYRDYGNLQDSTGLLIDNGDNPPDPCQLTINTDDLDLQRCERKNVKMSDFRISPPIFTAVIPEAPYGTSIKDFLEEGPIPAGNYPTVLEGYFVLLEFTPNQDSETYYIHSWASAGREEKGPYFSELLYEIQVFKRDIRKGYGPRGTFTSQTRGGPRGRITNRFPARNKAILNRILMKKKQFGEFDDDDVEGIRSIVETAKLKNGII